MSAHSPEGCEGGVWDQCRAAQQAGLQVPALQSATDVIVVHKAEKHLQQCEAMLVLLAQQCLPVL